MPGVGVVIKGLNGLKRNGKIQMRRTVSSVGEALEAGAEVILQDSLERVPVLSGDLKRSGRVKRVKRVGNLLVTAVIYGGKFGVDYAKKVHEDPSNPDSKFLEKSEKGRRREVKRAIAASAKG